MEDLNPTTSETICASNEKLEDILQLYLNDNFIDDGYIIGYFNELETFTTIIQKMKEKGYSYSVRDSDMRKKGKNGLPRENDLKTEVSQNTVFYQLKAMSIKFFGMPFTVEKTTHYQCAFGCKYYKSRAKSKADVGNLPVKKRRNVISKKMGCMAKMTLKKITVYPKYQLEAETDWRRKKMRIECLRRDLLKEDNIVENHCRYYLSVSIQSSHNHPPTLPSNQPVEKPRRFQKVAQKPARNKRSYSEPIEEMKWESPIPVENDTHKSITLQDANFFNTLVKFPGDVTYDTQEVKPVIALEINAFEQPEQRTFQIQYHPSLQDLHTIFKEKLKRLYTACETCYDSSLLIRLVTDLEQVELALSPDVNYDASIQ